MLPSDIGFWYCCLNDREQGVLRGTIMALAETLYVGVPKEIWDAFWLPYTGTGAAVRQAFLTIYGLKIVTIEVGDPPLPVEVVRSDDVAGYAFAFAFLLTPAAACIGGCQQSKLPWQT